MALRALAAALQVRRSRQSSSPQHLKAAKHCTCPAEATWLSGSGIPAICGPDRLECHARAPRSLQANLALAKSESPSIVQVGWAWAAEHR